MINMPLWFYVSESIVSCLYAIHMTWIGCQEVRKNKRKLTVVLLVAEEYCGLPQNPEMNELHMANLLLAERIYCHFFQFWGYCLRPSSILILSLKRNLSSLYSPCCCMTTYKIWSEWCQRSGTFHVFCWWTQAWQSCFLWSRLQSKLDADLFMPYNFMVFLLRNKTV